MSKQYDSYALFFRCRPTTPPQFKQLWKLVLRKLLSRPPSLSLPRSASCHKLSTTQLSFNVCNQKMWSHHECKAKEDKFIYYGLKWQASDCWGFCLSTSWKTIFASRQCHTPRPFSTASKQVIWEFNRGLYTVFENHPKCRIWIFNFGISTNFCPIKTDLSGNTVWPQASAFLAEAKKRDPASRFFPFC